MRKEIIIDGVDVSKCPDFAVSHNGAMPCGYLCKVTPNCEFKLVAKNFKAEQTLEKIKGIVEDRSFYCENCSGEFDCNSCGYIKILNIFLLVI